MTKHEKSGYRPHGPENAEHELKVAYNHCIETGVTYVDQNRSVSFARNLGPERVFEMYRTAYDAYRDDDLLKAERWARTTKHLSRALWHEAKIEYLNAHSTDLPFLGDAREEFHLHENIDTTADLLQSLVDHPPEGMERMPQEMTDAIEQGREHLRKLDEINLNQELLRAEHIKAAHEYGRTVECLALAYSSEAQKKAA